MRELDYALQLLSERSFGAAILADRQRTRMRIEYTPDHAMTFFRDAADPKSAIRLVGSAIEAPTDHGWSALRNDEQWMRIVRLLDPRAYYLRTEEAEIVRSDSGRLFVTARADTERIVESLPRAYLEWLDKHDARWRQVTFKLGRNNELREFEQPNLPPFHGERIVVRLVDQRE